MIINEKNILEIENLAIGFKGELLNNINASVMPGTLTALMGVNGVGKSCLLKTISRLNDIKNGSIKLNGIEIKKYSPLEFAQSVAVVLTEKFNVDFLRVDELIELGRSPYTGWRGELSEADKKIVATIISQIGLGSLKEKFFSQLSDGQKQKVLIARALAQNPKLLILDEPTTYLDIPSKIELIKLLKVIASQNHVAIVMSTHDLELIKDVVDAIWLIGLDGSFVKGSPAEINSAGLFKKHFHVEKY